MPVTPKLNTRKAPGRELQWLWAAEVLLLGSVLAPPHQAVPEPTTQEPPTLKHLHLVSPDPSFLCEEAQHLHQMKVHMC